MSRRVNWAYRPASYVGSLDTRTRILNRISGTARRRGAEETMDDGTALAVPADVFDPLLDDERLRQWGRVHPAMMGGEYLPEIAPDEIEIARIELQSVTGDVISVRAREEHGRFAYSIADEYQTEFNVAITHDRRRLSMRQMVWLINRSYGEGDERSERLGIALGIIAMNLDNDADADSMLGFVTVRSDFYPQLENYFDRLCNRYILWRTNE